MCGTLSIASFFSEEIYLKGKLKSFVKQGEYENKAVERRVVFVGLCITTCISFNKQKYEKMLSEKDCGNNVLEQWQAERTDMLKQLEQNEEVLSRLKQDKESEIHQLNQTHKFEIAELKVNVSCKFFISAKRFLLCKRISGKYF